MTMRHSGLFMVGIVGPFQFQDHIMHVITIDSCFELPLRGLGIHPGIEI
jgi:hypothetical protein